MCAVRQEQLFTELRGIMDGLIGDKTTSISSSRAHNILAKMDSKPEDSELRMPLNLR